MGNLLNTDSQKWVVQINNLDNSTSNIQFILKRWCLMSQNGPEPLQQKERYIVSFGNTSGPVLHYEANGLAVIMLYHKGIIFLGYQKYWLPGIALKEKLGSFFENVTETPRLAVSYFGIVIWTSRSFLYSRGPIWSKSDENFEGVDRVKTFLEQGCKILCVHSTRKYFVVLMEGVEDGRTSHHIIAVGNRQVKLSLEKFFLWDKTDLEYKNCTESQVGTLRIPLDLYIKSEFFSFGNGRFFLAKVPVDHQLSKGKIVHNAPNTTGSKDPRIFLNFYQGKIEVLNASLCFCIFCPEVGKGIVGNTSGRFHTLKGVVVRVWMMWRGICFYVSNEEEKHKVYAYAPSISPEDAKTLQNFLNSLNNSTDFDTIKDIELYMTVGAVLVKGKSKWFSWGNPAFGGNAAKHINGRVASGHTIVCVVGALEGTSFVVTSEKKGIESTFLLGGGDYL